MIFIIVLFAMALASCSTIGEPRNRIDPVEFDAGVTEAQQELSSGRITYLFGSKLAANEKFVSVLENKYGIAVKSPDDWHSSKEAGYMSVMRREANAKYGSHWLVDAFEAADVYLPFPD